MSNSREKACGLQNVCPASRRSQIRTPSRCTEEPSSLLRLQTLRNCRSVIAISLTFNSRCVCEENAGAQPCLVALLWHRFRQSSNYCGGRHHGPPHLSPILPGRTAPRPVFTAAPAIPHRACANIGAGPDRPPAAAHAQRAERDGGGAVCLLPAVVAAAAPAAPRPRFF